MDFETEWDVDKYQSPFESEEHWQLRRNFLVTHKTKYPEDQLICLAQVFFNVELLGCRYPEETMNLVKELSEGVADDFREKKQQKLQRTFVRASDAAEAKFKGLSAKKEQLSNVDNEIPVDVIKPTHLVMSSFVNDLTTSPYREIIEKFIIWKSLNSSGNAYMILQHSLDKGKLKYSCNCKENKENPLNPVWSCEIVIQEYMFASAKSTSKQKARLAASEAFLLKLQDVCYTVEEKVQFLTDGSVVERGTKDHSSSKSADVPIVNNSVSARMMKLMGWKGGGLGKTEQGITEPITAQKRIQRNGLGKDLPFKQALSELWKVVKDYAQNSSDYDLIFSNDFSKEERAALHQMARKLNLKSRSYGKDDDRHLVLTKKETDTNSILYSLVACGGENERFKLLPPLNEMDDEPYSC